MTRCKVLLNMCMVCVVFKLYRIRKLIQDFVELYWFWFSFVCFNDHYTTEEYKLTLYAHYKYFDRHSLFEAIHFGFHALFIFLLARTHTLQCRLMGA
jgi:hypothetical protein